MDQNGISMFDACILHERADNLLRDIVARHLVKYGVSHMQWLLLGSAIRMGKDSSMGLLAKELGIGLPQTNALSRELISKKLAYTKASTKDKRIKLLMATSLGKIKIKKIEKSLKNEIFNWLKDIPKTQLSYYMRTVIILAERGKRSK